jgi:hypothetical protein
VILPQDWTKIISASMVPVAIISASALLCLAFYNRLASVVSRLRGFQRERLQEYEAYAQHKRSGREDASSLRHHRQMIKMLHVQTTRVYRRARLIRAALLCLLAAIGLLTLCSLSTGLGMLAPTWSAGAGLAAEGFFLAGMLLLLAGALFGFAEIWGSLEPVHLETQVVTQLGLELDAETFKDDAALPVNGHGSPVIEKGA